MWALVRGNLSRNAIVCSVDRTMYVGSSEDGSSVDRDGLCGYVSTMVQKGQDSDMVKREVDWRSTENFNSSFKCETRDLLSFFHGTKACTPRSRKQKSINLNRQE